MDEVLPPEEDADIPAFCQALGVPGLADIHVHFLPPRMLRRVWDYFDQAGPLVGVSWPIRYKWSDEERVARCSAARRHRYKQVIDRRLRRDGWVEVVAGPFGLVGAARRAQTLGSRGPGDQDSRPAAESSSVTRSRGSAGLR